MANKKMTQKIALACALACAKGTPMPEAAAAAGFTAGEVLACLEHMVEMANKPRKGTGKTVNKNTLALEKLAHEATDAIKDHGKPVGTTWLVDNVTGILTAQKATAVMRKAIQLDLVKKVEPYKGKVRYNVV